MKVHSDGTEYAGRNVEFERDDATRDGAKRGKRENTRTRCVYPCVSVQGLLLPSHRIAMSSKLPVSSEPPRKRAERELKEVEDREAENLRAAGQDEDEGVLAQAERGLDAPVWRTGTWWCNDKDLASVRAMRESLKRSIDPAAPAARPLPSRHKLDDAHRCSSRCTATTTSYGR